MSYQDDSPSYGGNGYLLPDPTESITHSLLTLIDKDEDDRKRRMAAAWQAYMGQLPPALERKWKPGQKKAPADDNVQINNARLVVDRGIEFLAGKDYEIEWDSAPETDDASAEPASDADEASPQGEALDAFWKTAGGALTFQKIAQNGGVCGHAFAKLTEPLTPGDPAGLEVLDPSNLDVIWNPDDHTDVWEYRITWTSVDPDTKRVSARRERHVKDDRTNPDSLWTIIDEISREGGRWEELGRDAWPYPWPAVADCQNLPSANEYWGISDLEPDVIGLCQAINRSASNLNRLLRLHAHRHWWASGVKQGDKFDLAPDTIIRLSNPDAKMGALEVVSDLSSALEFLRELKQALHEITSVPEVATGKLDTIGQLSGLALGILYGPLIAKTEKKQGTYGAMLETVSERALWLAGYPDEMVVVHWPELVPSDPIAEREAFLLDQQLGVSQATILEKLGYDPQLEAEKRAAEEQAAMDVQQRQVAQGLVPGADAYTAPPRRARVVRDDQGRVSGLESQ